jgi:transcriptional regulator with XRE-family HTH domain
MPRANGPKIRRLRQEQGLKRGDLARRVDIQPNNLTNIECDLRLASIEVLNRIARVLGVSPEDLIATAPTASTAGEADTTSATDVYGGAA